MKLELAVIQCIIVLIEYLHSANSCIVKLIELKPLTMARKDFDPSQIDEKKLLEMIATVPEIAIPVQDGNSQTADPPQTPTTANHPGDTDESRMIPQPDYEETFLRKISLKHRVAVYVSEATRDKLAKITCLGPYDFSMSSLVENILQNHFELFKDEVNRLYKAKITCLIHEL